MATKLRKGVTVEYDNGVTGYVQATVIEQTQTREYTHVLEDDGVSTSWLDTDWLIVVPSEDGK